MNQAGGMEGANRSGYAVQEYQEAGSPAAGSPPVQHTPADTACETGEDFLVIKG